MESAAEDKLKEMIQNNFDKFNEILAETHLCKANAE